MSYDILTLGGGIERVAANYKDATIGLESHHESNFCRITLYKSKTKTNPNMSLIRLNRSLIIKTNSNCVLC